MKRRRAIVSSLTKLTNGGPVVFYRHRQAVSSSSADDARGRAWLKENNIHCVEAASGSSCLEDFKSICERRNGGRPFDVVFNFAAPINAEVVAAARHTMPDAIRICDGDNIKTQLLFTIRQLLPNEHAGPDDHGDPIRIEWYRELLRLTDGIHQVWMVSKREAHLLQTSASNLARSMNAEHFRPPQFAVVGLDAESDWSEPVPFSERGKYADLIGNWRDPQNQASLACAKSAAYPPEFSIKVVGADWQQADGSWHLRQTLAGDDRFELLGRLSDTDMLDVRRRSFASLSLGPATGLQQKAWSALAEGTPVIMTAKSARANGIHADAALTVQSLAEVEGVLSRLAGDPQEWTARSESSRRLALATFGPGSVDRDVRSAIGAAMGLGINKPGFVRNAEQILEQVREPSAARLRE